ncbi:MAG TPA: LysR family transcriptional regulator [Pyrinomonadaceae bacterium]|jgi:DNA-binding transcriptional LysR family regulator
MEIRQLKAFTAIVDTGTFTAGAARVHVTQAAISMQIRQLETEVGARLFVRAPRRVLLTEAGESLLARARRILREHDAALAEIAELAGAEYGRLRVGSASGMVSAEQLPEILKALREAHPRAEITVSSGTSEELVKQILAGELDMAFVSLPVESNGIQTEVLSQDELVAIASPQHAQARQRVVSAYTLAQEKLILGERGGNTRRLIDEFFAAAGITPLVAMELSRQAAIKRMVEQDMGIGIIPRQTVREELADGRLVAWWIEGAQINWELGLARLSDGYDSPICQTFIRLCREHFKFAGAKETKSRKPQRKAGKKAKGRS